MHILNLLADIDHVLRICSCMYKSGLKTSKNDLAMYIHNIKRLRLHTYIFICNQLNLELFKD